MRRAPQTIDELDRQLCELLITDPRASMRGLAGAIGVTGETVTSRLRRLRDMNVLGTTVFVDWERAGYRSAAQVRVQLRAASAADVAPEIVGPGVHFLASTTGCCDLFVAVLATDMANLRKIVRRVLEHRAIGAWRVDVVTETNRFELRNMTLPLEVWSPLDLPDPNPVLDPLDMKMITLLSTAAEESNRELARRLGVSDGTLRTRLRRLEDAGLVRVVAGVDPIATGDLGATSLVFITTRGEGSIRELLADDRVMSAYQTVGVADLVLMVGARHEHDMQRFLAEDLRRHDFVDRVEVATVVEVFRHQNHLARLVPPQPPD